MRCKMLTAAAVMLAMLTAGCSTLEKVVYRPDINQGNYLSPNDASKIHKGMTQQQVADAAHIQTRQYQRLENGERNISGASMRIGLSVCAVLKLDPYRFMPEFRWNKD